MVLFVMVSFLAGCNEDRRPDGLGEVMSLSEIQLTERIYAVQAKDTIFREYANFLYRDAQKQKVGYLYLSAGKAYRKTGDQEKAAECYIDAEEIGSDTKDIQLTLQVYYELGMLSYDNNDHKNAFRQFRKMKELYDQYPDLKKNVVSNRLYMNIGICFFHLERYGLALKIFKTLESEGSIEAMDSTFFPLFLYSGISFGKRGRFDEAKQYLWKSLKYATNSLDSARCRLAMSGIFRQEGKADSMTYYLEPLDAHFLIFRQDWDLLKQYYFELAGLAEIEKNFQTALEYFKKYDAIADSIYMRENKLQLDKVETTYKAMRLKNEYLLLRTTFWRMMVLFLLLCIGISVLFFWMRHISRRRKYRYIAAEDLADRLKGVLDQNTEKLQELLLHNLEISRKLAEIKVISPEKHARYISQLFLQEQKHALNWEEMYLTTNLVFDGFKDKITQFYPELNEKEMRLCCLLRLGLNTNDIAFMTEQSIYTVQKRRSSIRKKLNMEEGGDIVRFLSEH